MKYFTLLLLLISTACQTTPSSTENSRSIQSLEEEESITYKKKDSTVLLDHKYFTVLYDKDHRLAKWVQYRLTKENLQENKGERVNRFRPDPLLEKMRIDAVKKADIVGKEYDKGHLAPADDFKRSQEALDETFVMSNIAPQRPELNQSAWRSLEVLVQKWGCGEEDITIITGPILKNGLPKLAAGISIPDRFFKAVYAKNKSICFVYSQKDDRRVSPEDRVMSVNECEKEIGFDIGPESAQNIESKYDLKAWKQATCRTRR